MVKYTVAVTKYGDSWSSCQVHHQKMGNIIAQEM